MDDADLRSRLNGITTSLVTPFRGGAVDIQAYTALIEWQIGAGVAGLVACGTTGEVSTLAWEERIAVIRATVRAAAGRVPVIAGTGTNSTQSTIAFTSMAQSVGADAALVVTPYYNRPSQEGLFRHFEAVADRADMPVLIGNFPACTGVDMTLATLERLAAFPGLVGIVDGSADLSRPPLLVSRLGDRFLQLSGHDATSFAFNAVGGQGTVTAAANAIPKELVALHAATARGDFDAARALDARIRPLRDALGDSDPASVKAALRLLRGLSGEVRLPLVPLARGATAAIEGALSDLARRGNSTGQAGGEPTLLAVYRALHHSK
ncbi:4-hydroxy-tetrahydrodipicolinate synthase [Kaistia terrae]|uniref:4-hydroxy-tetrahydrodipicolinate synthase n=1 Tax=Kaistia terrae TaxID=537017 RepID=A0ABW0Q0Z3_9HYPH|nr:4-hydroxy-tetrahydrodipicolinate synthase [Kaistia terrae]MCX5579920.1 4-hydroxy-tetrahydrodipicolinate synthase [Kaistia terrae]